MQCRDDDYAGTDQDFESDWIDGMSLSRKFLIGQPTIVNGFLSGNQPAPAGGRM
jgi:hypothetical protein